MVKTLIAAASLLPLVRALPGASKPNPDDPRFTQWQAPGPGDGLNSLANHGFINRNGKNLTFDNVNQGSIAGLNMGVDFTTAIFTAGLLSAPQPLGGTFDLNDLDMHNFPIEHDASLSRQDAFFGNNHSFNQTVYNQWISVFGNATHTSIQSASKAKITRLNDSKRTNPELVYSAREFILSYGETGLYLQTMSDPFSGVARLDYIRDFFENERLPYQLGWRPSKSPITLPSLGQMLVELFLSSGETIPEGLQITTDLYGDLLSGVGPVGNLLGNQTKALGDLLGLHL